jgi:hypothetical protein
LSFRIVSHLPADHWTQRRIDGDIVEGDGLSELNVGITFVMREEVRDGADFVGDIVVLRHQL